jgi:hypothetical protein
MYVCISDDYELGAQYSIPFGGFMSCSAGNPLAMTSRKGELMCVNNHKITAKWLACAQTI